MVEFCDRFKEQVGELIVSRNIMGSCNKSVAGPSKETNHRAMEGSLHSLMSRYEPDVTMWERYRQYEHFSTLEKDLKTWNYSEHTVPKSN